MDASAYWSITYGRLLLLILGIHGSLSLAKPGAKAEVGGGISTQGHQSETMVASGRRSLLRRRMGSPISTQTMKNLAEYKTEISRKMAHVRTPEDFLRVFFPVNSVKSRWTKMVNESVQNAWRTGRTQDAGAERPVFTSETADQEMAEVNQHSIIVQCREPVPVLIDIYEELNLIRGGLVNVFPECTKVRRCDNSGCCPGGAPCVGKEGTRRNITKPFIVITVRPDSTKHKDARYVKHSVYADTECVCKEQTRAPACQPTACSQTKTFDQITCLCLCNKPCPRPYIQDPDNCDCVCDQKDGGCKKIKRSRKRMTATECTCVMDNRCLQPACNKGYAFSTTSCKCSADGSKQRNSNRKRDRERDRNRDGDGERDGRTDDRDLNPPDPPPPFPRGRTNINQPFELSSPDPDSSSSDSGDQGDDDAPPAGQEGLFVSWDSEAGPSDDCESSNCRSHTSDLQGNDNGSGGAWEGTGGDVVDF